MKVTLLFIECYKIKLHKSVDEISSINTSPEVSGVYTTNKKWSCALSIYLGIFLSNNWEKTPAP